MRRSMIRSPLQALVGLSLAAALLADAAQAGVVGSFPLPWSTAATAPPEALAAADACGPEPVGADPVEPAVERQGGLRGQVVRQQR